MLKLILTSLTAVLMAFAGCANGPEKLDPNRPEHHTAEGFRNLHGAPKKRGLSISGCGISAAWRSPIPRTAWATFMTPDMARIAGPAPIRSPIGHSTALIQYNDVKS